MVTYEDVSLRVRAIVIRNSMLEPIELDRYDCLFFTMKQFSIEIQERFQTVWEVYEAMSQGYGLEVKWPSPEISFNF